jgi:hypothetical protein
LQNRIAGITVSEPFDFSGHKGSNRIVGRIVTISSEGLLIFETNKSQELNGGRKVVLLTPQHYGHNFNELSVGAELAVNGSLLHHDLSANADIHELIKGSRQVLTGTIILDSQ